MQGNSVSGSVEARDLHLSSVVVSAIHVADFAGLKMRD